MAGKIAKFYQVSNEGVACRCFREEENGRWPKVGW
jgi:hypothetical protein